MKLNKGEKVVITCIDNRQKFEPQLATVVTCGRKWVTVQIDGTNHVFPYYFNNEDDSRGFLYGGCKDGSFEVYKLWNYPSVEEYKYQMELMMKKFNLVTEIKTILELHKYDFPIIYLEKLKGELDTYNDYGRN